MGCLNLLKLTWFPFFNKRRSVSPQSTPLTNIHYTENEVIETPRDSAKEISLSTSAECIESTVQSIFTEAGISVSAENLATLTAESFSYLEAEFPFNTESKNYDFLVVSSESDRRSAADTVAMLSSKCNLVGALFLDCIPIGASLFETFESLCQASSKVILYLTKDFIKDDFCSRIVSLVYLHRRNDLFKKILPFLDKDSLDIELPRCLQLVDKLWLRSELQVNLKWPKMWTPDLKNQRFERDKESLLKTDHLKKEILREFLYLQVGINSRSDYDCI